MNVEKRKLREQFRGIRHSVTPKVRQAASQSIAGWLAGLSEYKAGQHVALFAATPDEVDLNPFWERCRADGKHCYFPRVMGEGLQFLRVASPGDLHRGVFGILEPSEEAQRLNPDRCDLIIVPGIAFDRKGGRLGRGKGFYDRYLPQVSGCRVGVCYDRCLVEQVPCEPHDVRMHVVVTESGVVRI